MLLETKVSRGVSGQTARCPGCGSAEVRAELQAPDRFHARDVQYELLRCQACTLVWLKDPPAPAEMGQHYGTDYDAAIGGGGADPRHWKDRVDAVLARKSGGALLDLGCNTGGFLKGMKGPAWKLYGIEMSDRVARYAAEQTGAEIFVGDILDAPFAPQSFDVITCFHVFEHMYVPDQILAKVALWLKPGGIFYLMVPNIDSAGARIFKSYWYALELPRHLFHFSPVSLRTMCGAVGLKEVLIETHREVFIERSVRYIGDNLLAKVGIRRVAMAKAPDPGVPFRIVRKAFRLTLLPVLNGIASFWGDGESIHGMFQKTSSGEQK